MHESSSNVIALPLIKQIGVHIPMLSFQLKFELSFKLARGRTEGLGRPLEFRAYVNSTSEEKNLDDNDWEATVRVIKRAELEMTAVSDPAIVRYQSLISYNVEIH